MLYVRFCLLTCCSCILSWAVIVVQCSCLMNEKKRWSFVIHFEHFVKLWTRRILTKTLLKLPPNFRHAILRFLCYYHYTCRIFCRYGVLPHAKIQNVFCKWGTSIADVISTKCRTFSTNCKLISENNIQCSRFEETVLPDKFF